MVAKRLNHKPNAIPYTHFMQPEYPIGRFYKFPFMS